MVFARTTPDQKLQIVKQCQERGYRVGVTGDGVNDCPALKIADVGIAMNSGADVARDVASIVLLNNDFAAIVQAVKEGRLIFENLRKVIAYQICGGGWCELLPVLVTFFFGMPQPLTSFLMIMICCLSDVYAGVALMNEPAEHEIMQQPPRDFKTSRLIDYKIILYSYLFYGNLITVGSFYTFFLYMAERGDTRAVPNPIPSDDNGNLSFPAGYRIDQLFFAWNWGLNSGDLGDDQQSAISVGSSIFYICIVVAQMGHLLSIRRKTPYFFDSILNTKQSTKNVFSRIFDEIQHSHIRWPIVAAWILSICTINFFNYISVFQDYCQTAAVPGRYWGIAIGWSLLWFVVAELRKWVILLYPQSFVAKTAW
jgi:sodium/potassium-transporting ATPase subunit alpha